MDALAAGHDPAVQMIDTSVVRVHQHGACIADNNHQDMGRSRGGLPAGFTRSWIPTACQSVLPSRPVRHTTIGCARLSSSRCCHRRCCSRIVDTTLTGSGSSPPAGSMGKHSAKTKSQSPDLLQPVSMSRAQLDRAVLQQDQAISACRDPIRQTRGRLFGIHQDRINPRWLRAGGSRPGHGYSACIAFVAGAGCRQDCPVTKAAAFLHDPAAGSEAAASAFLAGLAVLRRINSRSQMRAPATMRVSPVHDDGMADIRCGRGGDRNELRLGDPFW